jgi:hypothetical protein
MKAKRGPRPYPAGKKRIGCNASLDPATLKKLTQIQKKTGLCRSRVIELAINAYVGKTK